MINYSGEFGKEINLNSIFFHDVIPIRSMTNKQFKLHIVEQTVYLVPCGCIKLL